MLIQTFGSSSKGNGYLLTDGDSSLLLEAGMNPKHLNVNWANIHGILITHEHGDHAKYIQQVIKRCGASVYCTEGTAGILNIPKYRTVTIKAKEVFTVGKWKILPFDVEHDVAEPVGFLIDSPSGKRILFATDAYFIRYRFNGMTHVMIECNYSLDILDRNFKSGRIDKKRRNRLLSSHFEIGNVETFLKSNDLTQLEEVHLLHLSDANSDAVEFKRRIERIVGVPVTIEGFITQTKGD